jgi:hypothetical protein
MTTNTIISTNVNPLLFSIIFKIKKGSRVHGFPVHCCVV